MSKTQDVAEKGCSHAMAEVKRICDSYVHNKEELVKLKTEENRLNKLKSEFSEESSRSLVEQRLSEIRAAAAVYERETVFFETMLSKLKERTFYVMFQLYSEGISWDFVKDQNGERMSRDSISRERRRGLSYMAKNYKETECK